MMKQLWLTIFLVVISLLATQLTLAASPISFFVNTAGQKVNAIEGDLVFSSAEGEPVIGDGGSIISFWVERPTASNHYHFAGIIPGGLATTNGLLFTVSGTRGATVTLTRVLGNEGQKVTIPKLTATTTVMSPSAITDPDPPESFMPVLGRDSALFDGQAFISFATQDKGSGVQSYEVAETYFSPGASDWHRVESPYQLADQSLHKNIYVRAIDQAGNTRLAKLAAPAPLVIFQPLFWLGLILVIILATLYLRRRRRMALVAMAALFSFGLAFSAQAATLGFSTTQTNYSAGQTFSVRVTLESPSQAANAVSGVVKFPADKVEVVSLAKTNSVVNLWVTEPTYSNQTGLINFEGAILNPGFTGPAGQIVTIQFKAIGLGSVPLTFSNGSVLANDGEGTNILEGFHNKTLTIGQGVLPLPPPPVPANLNLPPAPVISSNTHPLHDEGRPSPASFDWSIPGGVTAVRLLYDRYPASIPAVVYDPVIATKTIKGLKDGPWYFHAQFKNADGWGSAAHYRFVIDQNATSAPILATTTVATSTPAMVTPVVVAPVAPPPVVVTGASYGEILAQVVGHYLEEPLILLGALLASLLLIIILSLLLLQQTRRRHHLEGELKAIYRHLETGDKSKK